MFVGNGVFVQQLEGGRALIPNPRVKGLNLEIQIEVRHASI